jgi:hypothetical protein
MRVGVGRCAGLLPAGQLLGPVGLVEGLAQLLNALG